MYAGLGEERHVTEVGIKTLGDLGIATAGVVLSFHLLELTRANIERTANEASIAIAQQLNAQGHRLSDIKVDLFLNHREGVSFY